MKNYSTWTAFVLWVRVCIRSKTRLKAAQPFLAPVKMKIIFSLTLMSLHQHALLWPAVGHLKDFFCKKQKFPFHFHGNRKRSLKLIVQTHRPWTPHYRKHCFNTHTHREKRETMRVTETYSGSTIHLEHELFITLSLCAMRLRGRRRKASLYEFQVATTFCDEHISVFYLFSRPYVLGLAYFLRKTQAEFEVFGEKVYIHLFTNDLLSFFFYFFLFCGVVLYNFSMRHGFFFCSSILLNCKFNSTFFFLCVNSVDILLCLHHVLIIMEFQIDNFNIQRSTQEQ